MEKNKMAIGFAKDGAIVFKNSDMGFSEAISRVYNFDTEMFSFTIKMNKNKPNSFQRTYLREIDGNFKNAAMNIEIPFIENDGILEIDRPRGEEKVTIYECENGDYFLTYKEEFTKPYIKTYECFINFHIFSILKKVKNMYKIGTTEVFSVDQVEEFFAKSKLHKM
jgi:hypothetical protein